MVLLIAAILAYQHSQSQDIEDNEDSSITTKDNILSSQSFQLGNQVLQSALRCYSGENHIERITGRMDSNSPDHFSANFFRQDVRDDWINALFGPDFFATSGYKAPRQGVGLCNIPSYITYTATIPPGSAGEKLGMTLSRLPLGLYVHHVDKCSEAFFAGVQEDSILVDINGMGMLAEPSRQALERLWQYEGHFEDVEEDDGRSNASTGTTTSNSSSDSQHAVVREPVALTFFRKGKIYTVVMLSNPPWGISWAPCSNFGLVSRSYAFAAEAGVRRGSIVAAVNEKNIRHMDHEQAAEELRRLFVSGEEIRLTLCYTPPAARTGHFERQRLKEVKKKKKKATPPRGDGEGVEIRVHSLEESLSGFWGLGKARKPAEPDTKDDVAELARRVAMGEAEAPTGPLSKRGSQAVKYDWNRSYAPCPPLQKERLQRVWDPLDALVFCLRLHQLSHNEELFDCSYRQKFKDKTAIDALHSFAAQTHASDTIDLFLLQFISLICLHTPESCSDYDEKKTDCHEENALTSHIRSDGELTGILLQLSRRDQDFCQRLYFLLRSYIATFDERQEETNASSRNLQALLHCLDMLRSAEKQHFGRQSMCKDFVAHDNSEMRNKFNRSRSDHSNASSRSTLSGNTCPSTMAADLTPSRKKRNFLGFIRKGGKRVGKSNNATRRDSGKDPASKKISGEISTSASSSDVDTVTDFHPPVQTMSQDPASLYDNMVVFLGELDNICNGIERSLLRSFSEKITDWALQPWSARKGTALATLTAGMRDSLRNGDDSKRQLLVNPVDCSELLVSVKSEECYILPSAHFPLLLTFNVKDRNLSPSKGSIICEDKIYRTHVEIVGLRDQTSEPTNFSYVVHAAIAGNIKESGTSVRTESPGIMHVWYKLNEIDFETRSSCGAPKTLSLRLAKTRSSNDSTENPSKADLEVVGFSWLDLTPLWESYEKSKSISTVSCQTRIWYSDSVSSFDESGGVSECSNCMEIELKITTKIVDLACEASAGYPLRQRMLLYKHDDDLRQEAFAIQFVKICDGIFKASGLDLKLLTFGCVPVGSNRGFIEWVPGSVPLSEICQPFAGSILADSDRSQSEAKDPLSMIAKAGLKKYASLQRMRNQQQKAGPRGSFSNNPIQDFLRSVAYDPEAPYLIKREAMDNYVKSCAGYCVVTYLLGVGDRHLDNLLLHQSGCFFHCDYSFIFGNDPKKYLPLRITEDMVHGMGGRASDNYSKFLSLVGAAFLVLRRPESVRFLLSLIRLMEASNLPDLSEKQSMSEVVLGMRERMKLDLTDDKAISFMEKMIETSLSSKMWIAVDAIHSIGKRF